MSEIVANITYMEQKENETSTDAKLTVNVGFCRDCKFAKADFEFEQMLICKNPDLKLSAVFTMEGCELSVESDFGCVQFQNRT